MFRVAFGIGIGTILAISLVGCAGLARPPATDSEPVMESRPVAEIEYRADDHAVRAHNRTNSALRIHYGDVRRPRRDGMLYLRFRDREERILDVGIADGWFTPLIYSSQIYREPRRAELVIPAGSFVDLEWDVAQIARAVTSDAGRGAGPCEVQIRLFGYLDDDESRPLDARTAWMPGPCPGRGGLGDGDGHE
jgi:hypothetical protein